MREERIERRLVRSLHRGRNGQPLVQLDLADKSQGGLGRLALCDRVGAVFVGQARDLDDVVVAEAANRSAIRHVQDEGCLSPLHDRRHHRGGDALVALIGENVFGFVLRFLDQLAPLAREVRGPPPHHGTVPRRPGARKISVVHMARSNGHRALFNSWSCRALEPSEARM